MFLIEFEFADRGKSNCGFAGNNPTTLGATQVTKRGNSQTSHILCPQGIDSLGTPICLSMRSSSHKTFEMWCTRISLVARNNATKYSQTYASSTHTQDHKLEHILPRGSVNLFEDLSQMDRRLLCQKLLVIIILVVIVILENVWVSSQKWFVIVIISFDVYIVILIRWS
jgi:hypothetical protein